MKKLLSSLAIALAAGLAMAATPTPTPTPPLLNVTFAWNANPVGDKITNYKIYEQVGAAYTLLATVPATVTTYAIAAPASGTHTYVLTAVNARSESPKSNQALWPPTAHPPSGFITR